MPAASLRALLTRSIDYAGMFPPCSLELEPALKNQAEYTRSAESWMLSAFVLPIAKFGDTTRLISQFDKHHLLRVSALGTKTESAATFHAELKNVSEAIRSFQQQHGDVVSVAQLEMVLPTDVDLAKLADVANLLADSKMQAFWE